MREARGVLGVPSRLLLQRLAPWALRHHFVRGVLRVCVLFAADGATFLAVRAVLHAVREHVMLGPAVSDTVGRLIPRGYIGGWQFAAALVLGLLLAGCFGRGDARRDVGQLFRGVALAVGLSLWQSLWSQPTALVFLRFGVTLLGLWAALSVERLLLDRFVLWLVMRHREGAEQVVVVGDPEDPDGQRVRASMLAGGELAAAQWVDVRTHGADEDRESARQIRDRILAAIETSDAATVVVSRAVSPRTFEAIVDVATWAGVRVLAVPRVNGVTRRRQAIVWYQDVPFVELTVPTLRAWQLMLKRAMDLAVSGVALVLLSPLLAVIAAAIRLDSPGPAVFSQERVGYAGEVFRVLKFRTMRVGADTEKEALAPLNSTGDARLFKIRDDPRITQVGRILRRWSLDELPQLVNVLQGDMSLVGPRPFFEADLQQYLDHHFARLGAKPGMTGLWQVNGRSGVTSFEEVVRLDREYIDRWSLLLDLQILVQTLPAVIHRRGAY